MSRRFIIFDDWSVEPRGVTPEPGDTLEFPDGDIFTVTEAVKDSEDGNTRVVIDFTPSPNKGYSHPDDAIIGLIEGMDEDQPSIEEGRLPR